MSQHKSLTAIMDDDWHGCLTGDCPHGKYYECDAALKDHFKEQRDAHKKASENLTAECAALHKENDGLKVALQNASDELSETGLSLDGHELRHSIDVAIGILTKALSR